MKVLIVSLMILFLVGCGSPPKGAEDLGGGVNRWHDDEFNVTCYIMRSLDYGSAISCIPDSQLKEVK